MEVLPILSAMRRNKVGAILVAVQMAVTLAILCNALFIIEQRLALSRRPSGVDEAQLLVISNHWVGQPPDMSERVLADLAALRALPGVVDAYVSNGYPLSNEGWGDGADLRPDQPRASTHFARYFADQHAIDTLGVRLIAGRNFTAAEVSERRIGEQMVPPVIIISRAMAEALFPNGDALGRSIYTGSDKSRPVPVIGIIERLQSPWVSGASWAASWTEHSALEPFRFVAQGSHYLVRAQPGQIRSVLKSVPQLLIDIHPQRVIDKVQPLSEARLEVYRDDRGLALILAVVCAVLLAVTAFGIVGLTSYWVAQRRRQIGIRRALGATRAAVVGYFQTENLLIAACGAAVGVALAVALNLWMVSHFDMQRLRGSYALVGALSVIVLGQLAVLWPALRAASIPPALATRSA